MGNDVLWDIEDLAAYFKTSVAAIYYMRHQRKGPPALRVGRELRWDPDVVKEWAAAQTEPAAGQVGGLTTTNSLRPVNGRRRRGEGAGGAVAQLADP